MTDKIKPVDNDGNAVAVGEVISPATPAPPDTKAGSTADLKALHADLTNAYREYLEMAKIKPSMLNPGMLGLIQQFLKSNDIKAEEPTAVELNDLDKRLSQKRRLEKRRRARPKIITLTDLSNQQNDK